jgi:hypothetical protein
MKILILVCVLTNAEVLDRVAVSIGNQVITESQLIREIQLDSLLNNEPATFTPAAMRAAADRLIEQKLVRKEMEMGRYPTAAPEEASAMIQNLVKNRPDFARELAAAGIGLDELQQHLQWGLTLAHFIDLRFRPAVQVTNGDIEKYYREQFGSSQALADVRARITETLQAQRSDAALDAWLKDTKAHTVIEYRKEVFGEASAK